MSDTQRKGSGQSMLERDIMILYMIRHGQSTANPELRHAGWAPVPLTEKGIQDARMVASLLDGIHFDRVYSSDLLRSKQTQEIALPNVTSIETPLLREINSGCLLGKTREECASLYGEVYYSHLKSQNFSSYGGEDYTMQLERIRIFIVHLEEHPAGHIAAFTHEGSIRCMLDLVLGHRHVREDYPLNNGSVSAFELNNGQWSLVFWNKAPDQAE